MTKVVKIGETCEVTLHCDHLFFSTPAIYMVWMRSRSIALDLSRLNIHLNQSRKAALPRFSLWTRLRHKLGALCTIAKPDSRLVDMTPNSPYRLTLTSCMATEYRLLGLVARCAVCEAESTGLDSSSLASFLSLWYNSGAHPANKISTQQRPLLVQRLESLFPFIRIRPPIGSSHESLGHLCGRHPWPT